ncbi:TIGR03936 family radical SAM-associated protein [[Collinsella] massiliensis]|uniref:DUF2344 domain-containing protein n=1 Tax=[Collinsella] massiliensis TaxID=1232426 RepID=A0A1Y3XTR6_9ACTN|nr:TIGR03936 family radical SAM-associated protein [[Collinsella] massiliensis]OUN88923.1 hypothetical protein B5G02_03950 [[Collinsella] massiliensis]
MTEQLLFRLRVRYVKQGRLRYLGHLEVLHTIERVVRRAGLPYAVTQGFSPHMRAGFSAALPVGTASSCEWFDVFLTELVPVADALERLRAAAPADLAPQEAGYVDVRADALTAFITCAEYRVELFPRCDAAGEAPAPDAARMEAALAVVAARGQIPYQRGKKQKVLDLTRTLDAYAVRALGDGVFALDLSTRMDNEGALRPEILLAALDAELRGTPGDPIVSTGIQNLTLFDHYDVTRTAQYAMSDDGAPVYPLHP